MILILLLVNPARSKEAVTKMTLQPFDLEQVRLLDGPCKDAQEANRRYLHSLENDRLLYSFRVNAGLPAPGQPLGGWESPTIEVRGHFAGHYLSACALMYASTGDTHIKAKADTLVAELAKCQKALGGEYLSAFPESFWDRLETMQKVPWAAYYTIHKIMAGLYDMYDLCGNKQALDVLKGMAAYFGTRMDKLSVYQIDKILTVEYGGMSEVLHNLYSVTGNPDHLRLAHTFDSAAFLGPLALEHDNLSHIHGNTHIPIVIGAARHYELTGDERYRKAATYFWDRVIDTRTYAAGGTTVAEHWPEPNQLAGTLSNNNQECCKTHNMLKLTRYLFRWTGDLQYADYYERAYFNGILGTQEPETGMLMYYVPLATGSNKVFGTATDTFWCCYGTGVESFAKLGDSIYFHDDRAVYVNLFVSSTLDWTEKGIRLYQITRFPEEDSTALTIHCGRPVKLAIRIHVPYWATQGVEAKVNGKAVGMSTKAGSFASVERTWKDGDKLEIRMPMTFHAAPMPDDPELMAIMYGPLVLAGLTEQNDCFFLGDPENIGSWMKPVEGKPLTFRTVGQPTDLTFMPLNRIVRERYGVYWVVTQPSSSRHKQLIAMQEAEKARLARAIDRVIPGDEASEAAHALKGEKTATGVYNNHSWRHATAGGWWSWELKVAPGLLALCCTYWGSDTGNRTFDVLVNDRIIATETLNFNKPNEFYDVEYPLAADIVKDRDKITVMFRAHQGNFAGGVFGCVILKAE